MDGIMDGVQGETEGNEGSGGARSSLELVTKMVIH